MDTSVFIVGGYVRVIAEAKTNQDMHYNQFKLGEVYRVDKVEGSYVVCSNDRLTDQRLGTVRSSTNSTYDVECEPLGMDYVFHPQNTNQYPIY